MELDFETIFARTYPGFLSIRDYEHKIIYLNDNFRDWVAEYTAVDPIGKTNVELAKLVPKNVADTFMQCHDGSLDLQRRDKRTNGLSKIIEFKSEDEDPLCSQYFDVLKYKIDYKGMPHIFTIAYDITELYVENQYNLKASVIDPLTQAYNRRYFDENITLLAGHYCALLDLDCFKMVNDREGHNYGDEILKEFTSFLRKMEGVIAVVRLGGDEFVAIFKMGEDKIRIQTMLDEKRIQYKLKYPALGYLSFSYGIGIVEGNLVETLKNIDKAMYKDKSKHHEFHQ